MDIVGSLIEIDFQDGAVWVRSEYEANFRTAVEIGFRLEYFVNGPPREDRFRDTHVGMRIHERGVIYPIPGGLYVFPVSIEKPGQVDLDIGKRSEGYVRKAGEIRKRGVRTPEIIGYGVFNEGTKSEKVYLLPKLVGLETLPSILVGSVSRSKHYLDQAFLEAQRQYIDLLLEDMQVSKNFDLRISELSIPENVATLVRAGIDNAQDELLMRLATRSRDIQREKRDPLYRSFLNRQNVTEEDKRKCVQSLAVELRKAADEGVDFTDLAGRNVVVDVDFGSWLIDVEDTRLGRRLTKHARGVRLATLFSDPLLKGHIEKYSDIFDRFYL